MLKSSIFTHLLFYCLAQLILNVDDLLSVYLFALVRHLLRIVLNTSQFEQLHDMLVLT